MSYVDTIIDDMALFHDGPSGVLEVLNGWGSGAEPPAFNPCPAGWSAYVMWGHLMRDATEAAGTLTTADRNRPWRDGRSRIGNRAANTRIRMRHQQIWWLMSDGSWRLGEYRDSTLPVLYPFNWNEGSEISMPSPNYVQNHPGGGSSMRALSLANDSRNPGSPNQYRDRQWHPYANRHQVPAGYVGWASGYFVRRELDDQNGVDDREQCNILAGCAHDWYLNMDVTNPTAGVNVTNAGWSRLKYVTNDWQLVAHSSLNAQQLRASPPPFIGVDLVSQGVLTTTKRWFPGHYQHCTDGDNRTGLASWKLAYTQGNANFVGYQVSIFWGQTEGAQGDYSALYTELDRIRAAARTTGKKIWLRLFERSFHGPPGPNSWQRPRAMPQYIIDGGYTFTDTEGGENIHAPRLWDPYVKERFILWAEKCAEYAAANPEFVLISSEEWAIQGAWKVFATQQQYVDAIKALWYEFAQRMQAKIGDCLLQVNTGWSGVWPPDLVSDRAILDPVISTYKAVVGPTDLRKDSGYATLGTNFGAIMFREPGDTTIAGYQGIAAYAINYEWPDYLSAESPAEHLRWGVDVLKVHFIGWDPDRVIRWDPNNGNNPWIWSDALAAVNAANGRINTAVPTSISSGGSPPVDPGPSLGDASQFYAQLTAVDRASPAGASRALLLPAPPRPGATMLAHGTVWRFGDLPSVIARVYDHIGDLRLEQQESGNNDNVFSFCAIRENVTAVPGGGAYTITVEFEEPDFNKIAWNIGELREGLRLASVVKASADAGSTSVQVTSGALTTPRQVVIGVGGGFYSSVDIVADPALPPATSGNAIAQELALAMSAENDFEPGNEQDSNWPQSAQFTTSPWGSNVDQMVTSGPVRATPQEGRVIPDGANRILGWLWFMPRKQRLATPGNWRIEAGYVQMGGVIDTLSNPWDMYFGPKTPDPGYTFITLPGGWLPLSGNLVDSGNTTVIRPYESNSPLEARIESAQTISVKHVGTQANWFQLEINVPDGNESVSTLPATMTAARTKAFAGCYWARIIKDDPNGPPIPADLEIGALMGLDCYGANRIGNPGWGRLRKLTTDWKPIIMAFALNPSNELQPMSRAQIAQFLADNPPPFVSPP